MPAITAVGQTTRDTYTSGNKTVDNEFLEWTLTLDSGYSFKSVEATSTLGSDLIVSDPGTTTVTVRQDTPNPLPSSGSQTITFNVIFIEDTVPGTDIPFTSTWVQNFSDISISAVGQTTGDTYTSGEKTIDNELLKFTVSLNVPNYSGITLEANSSRISLDSFSIVADTTMYGMFTATQSGSVPLRGQQRIIFTFNTTEGNSFSNRLNPWIQPFETGEVTTNTLEAAQDLFSSSGTINLNIDDITNCLSVTQATKPPDLSRTRLIAIRLALGCNF